MLVGVEGCDRRLGAPQRADDLDGDLVVDPADPAFGQVVRVADFNPAEDQLEVQVESQGDVDIEQLPQGWVKQFDKIESPRVSQPRKKGPPGGNKRNFRN